MEKKLIWNDDAETVQEVYDVGDDFVIHATFKIGHVCFIILKDTHTGALIDTWVVDEGEGTVPDIPSEDFEVIPIEEVIKLLKK